MNKKIKYIIIGIICILFCGCSQTNNHTGNVITVTIEPIRYFTEAIAGPYFQVQSIVPSGMSPETYDPTPMQMVKLSNSVAYLQTGNLGFELNWLHNIQDNNPNLQLFNLSEGIELIREEENQGEHAHQTDPHIWTSPINVLTILNNICQALRKLDAEHEAYYQHRTDSMTNIVNTLDSDIRTIIGNKQKAFLIYHPSLTYFAHHYNLTQICLEEEGKEPSTAGLKQVIKQCKDNKVETVFIQREFNQNNIEAVAKELELNTVNIDPLSYHWMEELLLIAHALKQTEQ